MVYLANQKMIRIYENIGLKMGFLLILLIEIGF